MLDGRALGAVVEGLVDPRRMEREVLADPAVVDGDAGVLADEVSLLLGHLDVPEDGLEHALARDRGLGAGRLGEGVAEILRDVLERPDVEMGGGVLDDLLQIGGDGHQLLPFSAAASPARRPKTQHSSRELPIIRLRP